MRSDQHNQQTSVFENDRRLVKENAPNSQLEGLEPLLRVPEVAKILSVSPSCVRELARKGDLQGVKFTSDWRFKQSTVKEFIDNKEYDGYQARKERMVG